MIALYDGGGMTIQYLAPFSRAWERMVSALFRPFDLGKWLTVGFTAFLAELMGNQGGASGRFPTGRRIYGDSDLDELFDFPSIAWHWLQDHPDWLMLSIFALGAIIALVIVFTWLSSRGKFMFLDNVVHNRSKVTQPWHEFKEQANSLFVWRIGFGLVVFVTGLLFVIQAFIIAKDIYFRGFELEFLGPIIGMAVLILLVAVVAGYILAFLNNFVIPIMYKNRIQTNSAWRIFLSFFSKYWGNFVLFGIVLFLLRIAAVIVVFTAGLLSCCIGLVLIVIPYVGSVILLPISYTFRGFGPEFLAQFGEQLDIFPCKMDATAAS